MLLRLYVCVILGLGKCDVTDMLFNSLTFIYGFLPIVLFVFYVIGRRSDKAALSWLTLSSLFFYGYWKHEYLALIAGSMAFNYWLGGLKHSAFIS